MLGVPSNGDRAFDIVPPTSSYAIMRRARSYRGENSEPGKIFVESLFPRPELENASIRSRLWQRPVKRA
jgi:hypothetical protein